MVVPQNVPAANARVNVGAGGGTYGHPQWGGRCRPSGGSDPPHWTKLPDACSTQALAKMERMRGSLAKNDRGRRLPCASLKKQNAPRALLQAVFPGEIGRLMGLRPLEHDRCIYSVCRFCTSETPKMAGTPRKHSHPPCVNVYHNQPFTPSH